MSEYNKQVVEHTDVPEPAVSAPVSAPSSARRRLIKLGAVSAPVIATLTSRPALAWHCQTPSAWGSLKANPNTSLAPSDSALPYQDECWYISDWNGNVARSSSGYSSKPWETLWAKYPTLKANNVPAKPATKTTKAQAAYCDYRLITVGQLVSVIPGFKTSAPYATTMSQLFGSASLHRSAITAQLNFILCAPLANNMEVCLSPKSTRSTTTIPQSLQQMATRTYSPGKGIAVWGDATTIDYLYKTWMAR